MAKDLRQFLNELEAEAPDQVIRVKKEVDPHFEVTGVLAKLEQERKFPVVIFENVKGSQLPVVTNVHADARRLFRETPDGKRGYLTDQELTLARARAKQDVDDYCS